MIKFEKGVSPFVPTESDPGILEEIAVLKEELKDDLVILGHHYQRDDVIRFADVTGDSLILSQKAANMKKKHIVFCGVYFMAECADLLSADDQKVYLPDMRAGCAMADMANIKEVEMIWDHLTKGTKEKIIPITYINSSADIKYFVGKNDGIICTSSNAARIFDWAMERGKKILFLPDQYLGINTAISKSISEDAIFTLDRLPDEKAIEKSQVFLWNGYCSVHKCFTLDDVTKRRNEYPGINIVVHGECTADVVKASDAFGSTSTIIKMITDSENGSVWAVGTEQHLVQRLAKRFPDKTIMPLSESGFQCVTMSMITPEKLLATLKEIKHGGTKHEVCVSPEIKHYAKTALMRMLDL
ncbi:MAG: quinolinate synthase NadA [Candidatus Marinimicrobia bacterium]|nr:quinolinate synthase NadA [Candidatus Neomarinimicrobiota bacterium]